MYTLTESETIAVSADTATRALADDAESETDGRLDAAVLDVYVRAESEKAGRSDS